MSTRGTTDAIFAARQVMQKHREMQKDLHSVFIDLAVSEVMQKHKEMQKDLHSVFIDLEKSYNMVLRQEVWRCLREQYMPEKSTCAL